MDARDGGAAAHPAGPDLAGAIVAIAIDALTVGAAFWLLPAMTSLLSVPGPALPSVGSTPSRAAPKLGEHDEAILRELDGS